MTPTMPTPMPLNSAAMQALLQQAGLDPNSPTARLGSILGAIDIPPPPERMPAPGPTYPDAPRGVSPEFSRMILQALLSQNTSPAVPSLGALLAGR